MSKVKKDIADIIEPVVNEHEVQIAELTEALLRERADAMNVRRRAEEDRIKLGGFYKSLIVKELLPVIDNFERALKMCQKNWLTMTTLKASKV